MKITIELLGLPTLSSVIGKKKEFEIPGGTVEDLIGFLVKRHGPSARKALLDSDGNLDNSIQIMVNESGFLPRETLADRRLKRGDTVKFLLLAAGG
ncbi:MAG: MoaD/ThiS family protein [Deltaproteobacteria bacterium]|nr:MoaD/ThiS family protein [Deltaproteobacteria bacterium]MBW1960692.1 MoaD/ThiS family protein [Deltaproteobacteria bacterium]MBW2151957.1 MoaD/ThiS family protein [Deltaproteobacteria bacterium]